MQQDDILNRYRRLRAISNRHHNAALDYLARPALLERAKPLGLSRGQALYAEDEEAMPLVFDLAIHTARPGRSRAIDRYARTAALSADPDEARALEAIRRARFSIWRVERRHETAGLVIADAFGDGGDTWLVDEALTDSAKPGLLFASRLCWPAEFAITCGVIVPVDAALITEVALGGLGWVSHNDRVRLANDPRFATAIYRAAIDGRVMESVGFREVALAS